MGMTPLEGLMMGTRSGDIDPTVIEFLAHKEGISLDEIFAMLNKRSGLLGISGLTNDMRDLQGGGGAPVTGGRSSRSRCSSTASRSTWAPTLRR